MRAPAFLAKCWPGLSTHDKTSHGGVSIVSERDLSLPTPAVEIIPSKNAHPYSYTGENVDLQGFYIFKGRISVSDMIGMPNPDVSSKSDCSQKSGECVGDLVNVLKLEVFDGRLSFRGKQVLELGCGYGLAGILACLKGASKVHFQDINAETVRCMTIPNVLANMEQARDRQSRQSESPLTPNRLQMTSDIHFYAGDWEELHTVLSVVQPVPVELAQGGPPDFSFSEDDFMDGCSSQDGSVIGHESHRRRSQKLSGSRAWERASEADAGDGGYDIILMTEIPHSVSSLKKLYALITKCLRPPYGVVYLSVKRHFVGPNTGARQLRAMVDKEGLFGLHVVVELTDRDIWKFFFK